MNRENLRQYKRYVSQFLLGMYLIALFSQAFHTHENSEFSCDSHSKIENKISKTEKFSKEGDCLACHFLATGHTLVPEDFSFQAQTFTQNIEKTFSVQERIWSQTKFSFPLRGPPTLS